METLAPALTTAADRPLDQWLVILAVGVIAGVLGQSARVAIGLKKAMESATATGQTFASVFEPAKLWLSLMFGAIAGALAMISLMPEGQMVSASLILGLVAAGYAGSDFVEGILSQIIPGARSAAPVAPVAAPATDGSAAGAAVDRAAPAPGPAAGTPPAPIAVGASDELEAVG